MGSGLVRDFLASSSASGYFPSEWAGDYLAEPREIETFVDYGSFWDG